MDQRAVHLSISAGFLFGILTGTKGMLGWTGRRTAFTDYAPAPSI
jgi:hypothetical protein